MVKYVIKRDGRIVDFDKRKIVDAILKAMDVTEAGEDIVLAAEIAAVISKIEAESMSVEDIQDNVEMELMKSPRKEVAKKYIAYRNQRNLARKAKSREIFKEIIEAQATDVTRENANMNADTPAGMMMKFASESTKSFVDECLLSEDVKEAVQNSYIHIHDKDYYPTKSLTCVQHPLDKILKNGFFAGHGESRPAKRIETASILGCISMETVQNEMHGGQAIPAFDFYMAPFVRKTFHEEINNISAMTGTDYSHLKDIAIDDYIKRDLLGIQGEERVIQHAINMTVSRVHQSMEAFVHNMNSIHSRGGNQVVFSSINYGTDTSAEGRCVIREILNTTYEGVGNGSTAIFPIQIWKKKRGVSYLPEDKNYDLYKFACKVSARRFFPNFLNLDATFNQHELWRADDPERYKYEVATMGCRTRVFENRFGPKTSIARGNLSFTTINLVRLAIECMGEPDKNERIRMYFEKLDRVLDITAKQLCERYNFQKTALKKQFPLLMGALWLGSENLKDDDTIESVINQGTLGIGFIGLAETLIALIGKHHGESEDRRQVHQSRQEEIRSHPRRHGQGILHQFQPCAGILSLHTEAQGRSRGPVP